MEEFADRHGIDLAESYAYSDSLSDLPMLRAVGNPVAVNPDPPLAAIAREEGWQTLRFERLGRRLVALAVTLLATVAGFGARRVATSPPRRRRSPAPALIARLPDRDALGFRAGWRQQPHARSASSSPSPAWTATTAAPRSSPAPCATPAWR